MSSAKPAGRIARVLGNVLAALVLLGAPLGAVAALQPWQVQGGTSSPVPADDAVANGLNIVEPPLATADGKRAASTGEPQLETVVRNWTYTDGGRPKPSPGH